MSARSSAVLGKGLSHGTARFIQTLVSLLWNAAQDDGLVSGPVNPAHRAGRKLVFRGAKRLERRALRPDELERFLRAAERLGPRRAFLGFVVQSRTGVRTPPCSRFGARRSP
jgi:integrase